MPYTTPAISEDLMVSRPVIPDFLEMTNSQAAVAVSISSTATSTMTSTSTNSSTQCHCVADVELA